VVPAAVFPNLSRDEAVGMKLDGVLDLDRCLFNPELDAAVDGVGAGLLRALARMLGSSLPAPLSPAQVDHLRGLIDPSLVINRISRAAPDDPGLAFRPPSGDELVRVLDRKQEALAKSLGEGHRIIRGVAGSGKTLVLVYRARLVAGANPNKRYLVTCFTKTLAGQLRAILADLPNVTVLHLDGLMARVIREAGLRLPTGNGYDADRVAEQAKLALARGGPRYHGVFLDEAQDFGTPALQFVVQLLDPESHDLVIAADAAQNIFRRRFGWKQAGIQAQGRTRILRTNYRNTAPILDFAYRFLTAGAVDADELPDLEDETTVIPPEAAQRQGPAPQVQLTASPSQTIAGTVERVKAWLRQDASPRSIAILYASSKGPVAFGLLAALRQAGVSTFWATDPRDKTAGERHPNPRGAGDAGLHVHEPGAGSLAQGGRSPDRRLRPRRHPLRDPHRPAGVRRRDRLRDPAEDRGGSVRGPGEPRERPASPARPGDPACPGHRPRRPLPELR
jgi:hypothetical protein